MIQQLSLSLAIERYISNVCWNDSFAFAPNENHVIFCFAAVVIQTDNYIFVKTNIYAAPGSFKQVQKHDVIIWD